VSAVIFENAPGQLTAVVTNTAQSLLLELGGAEKTGVLVGLDLGGRVAMQVQPSLDRATYVTAFGDDAGRMRLNLILNSDCDAAAGDQRGTDAFLEFYQKNRLSPTNTTPARLTIGRKVIVGYATGFEISIASQTGTIFNGSLDYVAWLAE
jgi:hypothetical protein